MNEMHAANQRYWDCMSADWQKLRDQDQLWRQCPKQPELAFEGEALVMIRRFVGDLQDKRVCVIGSGDNYAVFALAGMGARLTSIDISSRQLEVARQRASSLGLDIEFLQADATQLEGIQDSEYDLVCSTNGFFVWIAEPEQVFRQVFRVLKNGGFYIFYDVHPFLRPWKDAIPPLHLEDEEGPGVVSIEMERPYTDTGPFEYEDYGQTNYQFHWRLSDLLNSLLDSGLALRQVAESPAKDARFWEGSSYLPGTDTNLLDWRYNPRAGLPAWLSIAAQKLQHPHPDLSVDRQEERLSSDA